MDWWTSINPANTGPPSSAGSLADHMSQIDTNGGIFDPWLNCDDLDLGTILHQASGANYQVSYANITTNSTTSTTSTTTPNTTATNSLLSPIINQSIENGNDNKCNGQHQQQVQGFSNYLDTSTYTSQQQDNKDINQPALINSQQQQQQQQQSRMVVSTPSSASSASSTISNKQNIFNFITSSTSVPSSAVTTDHHHQHPSKGRQSTLLSSNQNNSSSIINCTNSLASSTTSPLSSTSTCELSPLNTPLNASQSSINYLSSSPSSSTTSSLLINDNISNICQDVKPAILHNNNNNQQSNQRYLTNGHYHSNNNNANQATDHCRHQDKFASQQQQQHLARDVVHCKSNLENLLNSNSDNNDANRTQNNPGMQICPPELTSSNVTSVAQATSSQQQQQQQPQSMPVKSSNKSKSNDGPKVPKMRRCRHITDFVLADEEKRLLIKEGHSDFPMSCQARPLTKAEERILRKIRRKIRNKKSAQCSRQRKKEYVEELERKYASVIRENEELRHLISRIQGQSISGNNIDIDHHHHHHQQQQANTNELSETLELDWKDLFPSSTKVVHQQNLNNNNQHHQQQQQPNIYN